MASTNETKTRGNKVSPLYTSPSQAESKRKLMARLGKDKDGAYRVSNRIDKQS